MTPATLRIHCPELGVAAVRVELNGTDISNMLTKIELVISGDGLPTATICIRPHEVDVTAETLALLQAHLTKPKEESA